MKTILLNKDDINYLLNSKLDTIIIEEIKNGLIETCFRISLQIEVNSIEKILNQLSDDLIQNGLSNNYEPNFNGLVLEALIDKFAREFYY